MPCRVQILILSNLEMTKDFIHKAEGILPEFSTVSFVRPDLPRVSLTAKVIWGENGKFLYLVYRQH